VRSKKCDIVTTVTTHVNTESKYHMLLITVMSVHSVRRLHQLSQCSPVHRDQNGRI
jgi:hypothetical protein